MLTKYVYIPGSSVSDIYSDIKALLTGTTDKNLLSNSCDKPNSTIVSTVPAGWEETIDYFPHFTQVDFGVNGRYSYKIVGNGSEILLPVGGSTSVLRSIDDGITWTAITLPQVLGNNKSEPYGNLAYGSGRWIMTNPNNDVSAYVMSSIDGTTWTELSVTLAQYGTPVWNGTMWLILTNTAATLTSTDGITWIYHSAVLPASIWYNEPVYANGCWVVTPAATGSAVAVSVDGVTWTSIPITAGTYLKAYYINNKWFVISATDGALIYVSEDNTTWVLGVVPIGDGTGKFRPPIYINNRYVTIKRLSNTSGILYSYDGITWYNNTNGSANSLRGLDIVWVENWQVGVILNSGFENFVGYTYDGINYFTFYDMVNPHSSTSGLGDYVVLNNNIYIFGTNVATMATVHKTRDGVTLDGDDITSTNVTYITLGVINNKAYVGNPVNWPTTKFGVIGNKTSCVLKALYADGVNYKKVALSVTSTSINLQTAEDFIDDAQINLGSRKAKLVISTNAGGTIYISASARHIFMDTTTTVNPAGIFEYSRDDDWNVGSGANPYPSVCVFSLNSENPLAVPTLRFKVSSTLDAYDASLLWVSTAPISKLGIDAVSTTVVHAADIDIGHANYNGTCILGGKLLGGIKIGPNMLGVTNYTTVNVGGIDHIAMDTNYGQWLLFPYL